MKLELIAFAFTLLACERHDDRFKDGAQEEFIKSFSCPKERVTVTARKDLKAFDLVNGVRLTPPAEVSADPGRLAEWKKRQQDNEDNYNRESVFQASGCDHEVFYACSIATGTNDTQVVACSAAVHPPAK